MRRVNNIQINEPPQADPQNQTLRREPQPQDDDEVLCFCFPTKKTQKAPPTPQKKNPEIIDSQGRCRYIYEDGSCYEGFLQNNKRHFSGKMKYNNGDCYEGEWREDKWHGEGKLVYNKGAVVESYQGKFENSKKNGNGTEIMKNGDYFKGPFLDDKRHGIGQLYQADGTVFKGRWKNGVRDGHGFVTFNKTMILFQGFWEDGKLKQIISREDERLWISIHDSNVRDSMQRSEFNSENGSSVFLQSPLRNNLAANSRQNNQNSQNQRRTSNFREGLRLPRLDPEEEDGRFWRPEAARGNQNQNGAGTGVFRFEDETTNFNQDLRRNDIAGTVNWNINFPANNKENENGFNNRRVRDKKKDKDRQEWDLDEVGSDKSSSLHLENIDEALKRENLDLEPNGDLNFDFMDTYDQNLVPTAQNTGQISNQVNGSKSKENARLTETADTGQQKENNQAQINTLSPPKLNQIQLADVSREDNPESLLGDSGFDNFKEEEYIDSEDNKSWELDGEYHKKYPEGGYYKGGVKDKKKSGYGEELTPSGDLYKGQWEFDKRSGQGYLKLKNGDEYKGNFSGNAFWGEGEMTYTSDPLLLSYTGGWASNLYHGEGMLTYLNGDIYSGSFNKNERCGKGTLVCPDGSQYEGLWAADQRHGHGKQIFSADENDYYEGDWKEGLQCGEGKRYHPGGQVYIGEWLNGLEHGRGRLKISSTKSYQGEWKAGKKHGQGLEFFSQIHYYKGEFKADLKDGEGMLCYPNGDTYKGGWKEDLWHGQGLYRVSDQEFYKGEFDTGYKQGQGAQHYENGEVYEGAWFHSLPHGHGKKTYLDGSIYIGLWKKGKRNGFGKLFKDGDDEQSPTLVGEWKEDHFDGEFLDELAQFEKKTAEDLSKLRMSRKGLKELMMNGGALQGSGEGNGEFDELGSEELLSGDDSSEDEKKPKPMIFECAICGMEGDKTKDGAAYLGCLHWFHYDCIHSWFEKRRKDERQEDCPICRFETDQIYRIETEDELGGVELIGD